jgi:hypothetical protein
MCNVEKYDRKESQVIGSNSPMFLDEDDVLILSMLDKHTESWHIFRTVTRILKRRGIAGSAIIASLLFVIAPLLPYGHVSSYVPICWIRLTVCWMGGDRYTCSVC